MAPKRNRTKAKLTIPSDDPACGRRSDGVDEIALGGIEKEKDMQGIDPAIFSRAPPEAMQRLLQVGGRLVGIHADVRAHARACVWPFVGCSRWGMSPECVAEKGGGGEAERAGGRAFVHLAVQCGCRWEVLQRGWGGMHQAARCACV